MVIVVDRHSRADYAPYVRDMHKVRKAVFVDRLGWPLRSTQDGLEVDEFDTDDAVYLICLDHKFEHHLGSVRLLPTIGPHLLQAKFASLCESGPPEREDVWEITRLCTTPGFQREKDLRIRHKLTMGLVEFAIAHGVKQYACVLNLSWLPTLIAPGWNCKPLGRPQMQDGAMIGAFSIEVGEAALAALRERWGGAYPVLHSTPARSAA